VLQTEDDFYHAAIRYLQRVRDQGVVYVEMFFDPQMHTTRGITFATIMNGLKRAQREAADALNLRCAFIMCFNRDRPLESALEHLMQAIPYHDLIIGIGTDNPEHHNFPQDLAPAFAKAAQEGFHLTSHCDVDFESSVHNIRGCLDLLHTERIDHGINTLDDPELTTRARNQRIGFTVCPTYLYGATHGEVDSHYFDRCARAAKEMLDARLCVTLSSDDPGMMCSCYVGDIYNDVCELLDLSRGME
jgi:adenosine deaminase